MPVVTADQVVSLHTANGVILYQFSPSDYSQLTWSRQQRDASVCNVNVPPLKAVDRLGDIAPWEHWITVWDGERSTVLWTGPVIKPSSNRVAGLTLVAKDHAAYLEKTRNPMSKKWEAADPAFVAGEMWQRMLTQKGISNVEPIMRPDPDGDRFDFQSISDGQMLDQTMGDLVNVGLRWSVVSGVPILGPLSKDPVATLGDDDFIGSPITLVRDGSAMCNDVLVTGQGTLAQARIDYHGQSLQAIKNLDSMSGASNVARAARSYVKETGVLRTRLVLAESTQLHPNAPVNIDELMPSMRFIAEAEGVRELVELTSVEVNRQPGVVTVKISMESAKTHEELQDLELDTPQKSQLVTLGSGAAAK